MPKVAITGMGCVSACGNGVEPFWHAIKSGRSAVGPVKLSHQLGHKITIAAQVKPETLDWPINEKPFGKYDLFTRFALIAAGEAVAQSGLQRKDLAGTGTAVIIGSGVGGQSTQEESFLIAYGKPPGRLDPMTISRIMMSAPPSIISMEYGVTGPTFAVSSACASAAQAIGLGASMIRSGLVDRAIVGGTDAAIAPGIFRAWEAMRVLTPDACRPFSLGRNGLVLGEGAGIVILENAEAARARGATPLAELMGYGTSADAGDIIRSDPAGAAAAMTFALADARVEPKQINHINAHGTGTVLNDISESKAVRLAFGASADRIAISSTKPIHGHALGAAGALELIAVVRCISDCCAPPTLNWLERDPKCDLDIVVDKARSMQIDIALSNSLAFGGINASLIVGRWS